MTFNIEIYQRISLKFSQKIYQNLETLEFCKYYFFFVKYKNIIYYSHLSLIQ